MSMSQSVHCRPYHVWDSESDFLVTDAVPLFDEANSGAFQKYFHWAYSINTACGLFYRSDIVKSEENQIIKLADGHELTFSYTKELPTSLMLSDGTTSKCVMEDITVWPNRYSDKFLALTSNENKKSYIIDSRGEIFELPCMTNQNCSKLILLDRRANVYLLNGIKVYACSPEQRAAFREKSEGNRDAAFNREFNRFVQSNARNENEYLYLTAGNSKCGTLISFFAENGMIYEVVPNLFCDDESVNVRIPLTSDNGQREDVQFLCAKYKNTYSIYNIPYTQIGGGLVFPDKWKRKLRSLGFSLPKDKETMVYSVINTLRYVFETDDDYEVYKKSLAKIRKLMEQRNKRITKNPFTDLMLLHPDDTAFNVRYMTDRLDYINEVLSSSIEPRLNEEHICIRKKENNDSTNEESLFAPYDYSDLLLYTRAYEASKRRFKAKMEAYESGVIAQISAAGGTVSKWVNECNLFALVSKEYPDAVYQYHNEWLGLQSLDIYIPSLNIGIEYQGEQHYHAIAIFGGEEGLKRTMERDVRKAALCKEHGVKLLYWRYDEVMSKSRVLKRIQEAI